VYGQEVCTAGLYGGTSRWARSRPGPPSAVVAEGPWPSIIGGDALARAANSSVKPTGDRQMDQERILYVYVASVPVGVYGPPAAHPRPLAEGITAGYAHKQPLHDWLRRCRTAGAVRHLLNPRIDVQQVSAPGLRPTAYGLIYIYLSIRYP